MQFAHPIPSCKDYSQQQQKDEVTHEHFACALFVSQMHVLPIKFGRVAASLDANCFALHSEFALALTAKYAFTQSGLSLLAEVFSVVG